MKKNGSVLIIVLWVVMFLTAAVLSAGRYVRSSLALTDGYVRHVQAKAIAWAGIMQSISKLKELPPEETPHPFRGGLGDGVFNIQKIEDEERRLDLNALTDGNRKAFFELFLLCGLKPDQADACLRAILEKTEAGHKFSTAQEIALLNGVSKEIYRAVKDYLTVYPRSSTGLSVNFNTASRQVLQALGRSLADESLSADDADRVADRIISFRAGDDQQDGTADDRPIDFSAMGLNVTERLLAEKMSRYRSVQSDYFCIRSEGIYQRASVEFEAVVYRPGLSIVAWHKE